MQQSAVLKPDTIRLRNDVRKWSIEQLRPLARQAEVIHGVPDNFDAVLARCPVQQNPVGISTHGLSEKDAYFGGDHNGNYVLAAAVAEAFYTGDMCSASKQEWVGSRLAKKVIDKIGSEDQKERWMKSDASDGLVSAFALTEPHAGSDPSIMNTTARREGDTWVLNGTKIFASGAATADLIAVFATVDKSLGRDGIRCFIVMKDTPGLIVAKSNEEKLGIRCWQTATLIFEDMAIPADHMLGDPDGPGRGLFGALATLNDSRPIIASKSLGIGAGALQFFEEWFGNNKSQYSSSNQLRIDDEIRSMHHTLAMARQTVYRACLLKDLGRPNRFSASAAKATAPQAAERVCRRVIELMGPEGASEEFLVEKWYRDVKVFDIFEGTGEIHRTIMGRDIFGGSRS